MVTVVALDTSALTMPVELDIRLFEELERLLGPIDAIAPAVVDRELGHLADQGGRTARAASVGRALLSERCQILDTGFDDADDAVLALATEGPATHLVTADRELARRGLAAGVSVVSPRSGQHLALERP